MSDYIVLDAAYTAKAIDAMIAAYPELLDDEELRADSIEAETSMPDIMSRLVRLRGERLAIAEGLNGYIQDLIARRDRLSKGADAIKGLMVKLMVAARLPKLTLPEATISLLNGRETVSILDIDALPQGTFALIRQPDKAAIKAMIDAGEDVPGAGLVHGEPSISVRVK